MNMLFVAAELVFKQDDNPIYGEDESEGWLCCPTTTTQDIRQKT